MAVALLLAALAGPASGLSARLGDTGDDGIALGLAVSRAAFADAGGTNGRTAAWAVLGRDDVFVDNLAAGPLLSGGPLLLVPGGPDGELPVEVELELLRVVPPASMVYVAGGANAVSTAIEDRVFELGYLPVRLAGAERTATAAAIAAEIDLLGDDPTEILLATAGNWPDAVVGGAYAAKTFTPVLVTRTDTLAAAAVGFLDQHPDTVRTVLGGPAAIANEVADQAGATRRFFGVDRFGTAAIFASAFGPCGSVVLAESHADDGWTAVATASTYGLPVLLTGPAAIEPRSRAVLEDCTGTTLLIGGLDRLSAGLEGELDR